MRIIAAPSGHQVRPIHRVMATCRLKTSEQQPTPSVQDRTLFIWLRNSALKKKKTNWMCKGPVCKMQCEIYGQICGPFRQSATTESLHYEVHYFQWLTPGVCCIEESMCAACPIGWIGCRGADVRWTKCWVQFKSHWKDLNMGIVPGCWKFISITTLAYQAHKL